MIYSILFFEKNKITFLLFLFPPRTKSKRQKKKISWCSNIHTPLICLHSTKNSFILLFLFLLLPCSREIILHENKTGGKREKNFLNNRQLSPLAKPKKKMKVKRKITPRFFRKKEINVGGQARKIMTIETKN